MIWPIIRAALYAGLGAAEFAADAYGRAKRLGRRLLPRKREDTVPLSYRDVAVQQEQIRRSTRRPPK